MEIARFFRGIAFAAVLLVAAVCSVEADTIVPNGISTPFTDAQFSLVTFDGSQTATPGGALNILGCPKLSPQPACLDSGTVDIFFSGAGATALVVQGSKFWVDITGNLGAIFTSYGASGVGVTNSLTSINTGLGGQACYESNSSPSLPTVHGIANAICTSGTQSSFFALTQIVPDTFSASNGSIGVTFSLASSPVPEPTNLAMLLAGLAGIGLVGRNRFLKRS